MEIQRLLILGTADNGPSDKVKTFDLSEASVNFSLNQYQESIAESKVLSPSTTGISLSNEIWASDVKFIYQSNSIYNTISFPNRVVTGSNVYFDTSPVSESLTGWVSYKKIPSSKSLTNAIRQAFTQHKLTPVLDSKISTLRVVSSDAVKASLVLGPFTFKYMYPGAIGNSYKIIITSDAVSIVSPPESLYNNILSYPISSSVYERSIYKNTSDIYSDLIKKINTDAELLHSPVYLDNMTKSYVTLPISGISAYVGEYYLTGGTDGSAVTAQDYYTALGNVDPSEYDIIVCPGLQGQEIFPYASYLIEDFQGFPFSIVCSTTGTTLSEVANDLWQSERFYLVQGTGNVNSLFKISTDLSVPYAVMLSSDFAKYGGASKAPFNGYLLSSLESDELYELTDNGTVCFYLKNNKPLVYSGVSTRINFPTSASSVLRSVCRSLIPALYEIVGLPSHASLNYAEKIVKNSLDNAISIGCPIQDYKAKVSVTNTELSVTMEFNLYGVIEKITGSVSVPRR